MQTETRPHHSDRLKRLSLILPIAIADEICEQPTAAKAMILIEQAEDVLDQNHGFPELLLSATTTQWLSSLGIREQLQLCENLSLMLISEV